MNVATELRVLAGQAVDVFGFASGLGARDPGCALGPSTLLPSLGAHLETRGVPFRSVIHRLRQHGDPLDAIAAVCHGLAEDVAAVAGRSRFAAVGGDHSMAIGTWNGAARALAGKLGLIWIDAHMDAHTPQTTPSARAHGMPVAALLGHGDRRLVGLCGQPAAIDPANLTIIGVRS
jgi:arginase family enzyme